MISKYQKLDTLLNYGIEKTDEMFGLYMFLKGALEFYFVEYSSLVTTKVHELSKENIDYILGLSDIFSPEDFKFIKDNVDLDQFYTNPEDTRSDELLEKQFVDFQDQQN